MTASTGWCVVNPTKCAICTAQGTAESALCSKYGFATADYSFATEAATAGKCAGCATANDWLQIATTLDKFGTCIAEASVAATCGAGKYGAKEDKNNALTYCAPDATSATLCFVCHTSTKCNTYSYTETVTFGAAAIKAFPFATASAEPNTFCLTCKAATDYP